MANLGAALGGMAQARESRLGRELQERALGLQEKRLAFDENAKKTQMIEDNLTQLTELAAEAKVAGAAPVVDLMRNRVAETAMAAGMDPASRVAMFDAAMEGALTPEQEAANKAKGEVAGAQTVADATGAELNEVLQARGWLQAPPEQYETLSPEEVAELGLEEGTIVQVAKNTGEIIVKQGAKSQKIMTAIERSTGSPVFVTEKDILANPEAYMPQSSGMKLVKDGDNFVFATGTMGASTADLTNTTKSKLEGSEIDARNLLSRVENVDAAYDPSFLEFGSKAKGWWLSIREKLGGAPLGDLTPEFLSGLDEKEKKFLERYTVFTSRALNNMNRVLNELSGAAISPAEAERLRAELPDPVNDSPTEFYAKTQDIKRRMKVEVMKLAYARKEGLDALSISLEDFESVVDTRGKQLEQQVRKANPDAPKKEIDILVDTALMQEFFQ